MGVAPCLLSLQISRVSPAHKNTCQNRLLQLVSSRLGKTSSRGQQRLIPPGACAGVDYRVDNSIPGGSIRLSNQTLHIADSNFSGLTPYAQATLILQDSQVSMRRTSFVGNIQSVAGGIYADSSTLELDSCVFRNNFGYQGGAISLTGSSSLLIANTTEFTNNTGQQGGALSVTAGSAVVQNSIFNQNNCTSGGAVYLDHVPVAAFSDSSFTSNVATSNGGGIFSNDAGLLELSSCSFSNNKGQTGGAVRFHCTYPHLHAFTAVDCLDGPVSAAYSLRLLRSCDVYASCHVAEEK